jgi:hypothetical protein
MENAYVLEIETLNYDSFAHELRTLGLDEAEIDAVYDKVRVFHNDVTNELGEGNVGTLLEIGFDRNDDPTFNYSSYPID